MSTRAWTAFAAVSTLWGIPYLFIKIAVSELSPASLVFLRTGIGAALLLPVAAARRDLRPLLPNWKWIVAYTFVEVAAPWLLLSDAERRISSSLSGLLIALVPSIGAILAWATGSDDRLDLRRILGLGLGFLGVAALVGLDVGAGDIVAVGEVALVALGYALGALIIGRKLSGLPSFGVVAASLTLTLIAYAPVGIAQLPRALPSPQVILAVTVLGVVCTALAFLLFFPLVAEVGAARATVITYVNPAVALALGVAFLGEPLTVGIVLGFVLIVLGSVLATRRSAPAKESAALSRSPDLL
jgi:drug/metabolite transporter (DMT)-like permease